MKNDNITDIYTYMRLFATDLGERIFERYPALHQFSDAVSARLATLLRTPLGDVELTYHSRSISFSSVSVAERFPKGHSPTPRY